MILKRLCTVLLIMSFMTLCGCTDISFVKDDKAIVPAKGEFSFTVLKIGKADSIILKTQNHGVMIDCGEKSDGKKIVQALLENNINNIDYLFVTHFDKDHMGGFSKITKSVSISNIITPDYEGTNDEYKSYLKTVEENNLQVTKLNEDISFSLDDVYFEVSAPKKQDYSEGDNDHSLIISVCHGENKFLFAGDAEEERLDEVMREIKTQYDFLKVPHHGRYNKNTSRFINLIKPKYAVITDSDKNKADEKTYAALNSAGCNVYTTRDGSVTVISDGEEIKIIQ